MRDVDRQVDNHANGPTANERCGDTVEWATSSREPEECQRPLQSVQGDQPPRDPEFVGKHDEQVVDVSQGSPQGYPDAQLRRVDQVLFKRGRLICGAEPRRRLGLPVAPRNDAVTASGGSS